VSEFDSPWKEALDRFLPLFLEFFFPEVFRGIDWSRRYESLDKELQQIVREGELGPRLADKLFQVWRVDGEEMWVLIHIEVQNQPEQGFEERMYVYHYRIYDRYRRPVASLAVLGDDQPTWRPRGFGYAFWGCTLRMEFPIVKLLDYADRVSDLEEDRNPLAAFVLAHLKTIETRQRLAERRDWKIRLVKSLFDRSLAADEIREFFRMIDWVMDLPPELEREFQAEIHRFEEERQMPYVTSIERMAREEGVAQGRQEGRQEGHEQGLQEGHEKGRQEGIQEGRQEGIQEGERLGLQRGIAVALELKFGAAGLELLPELLAVQDVATLRAVQDGLRTANSLAEVRSLLK
jgi:hypothetical protein